MNRGSNNKDVIKKTLKLKTTLLSVIPAIGVIFVLILILVATLAASERMLPIFTSSSSVGTRTIYDDTYLMEQINKSIDDWTDEEKFVFTEMKRQKDIWVNDYTLFGIKHDGSNSSFVIPNYNNNDLDLVKFIVTIQHKGAVNIAAYDDDYSSYDSDIGYNGEVIVYNRDTKDFYIQAGKRLGSTFFLYPGLRQMMGNSISATIKFEAIHPQYAPCSDGNGYCLQNLDELITNWKYLGNMYMAGEPGYNNYYSNYPDLGPRTAASIFVDAINYGYENCLVNVPSDKNDWNYVNVCSDYKKIFSESNGQIIDYNGDEARGIYYTVDILEQVLNEGFAEVLNGNYALIPSYEYNQSGGIYDSNIYTRISSGQVGYEQAKWFIGVTINRTNDWDAYDEYLKDVYIPYLYINCENCNPNLSSEGILLEMKQMEETYRYYNHDDDGMNGGGSGGGGANINFVCTNGSKPHVATYEGHHGLDINSVPEGTNVYPLFEGEVVYINSSCRVNYAPERHQGSNGEYYTCNTANANNCGYGTYVVVRGVAADGKTYDAMYAHLSSVNVSVGQYVNFDTVIGGVGNTGCSTGAHLHLELRDNYTDRSTWHLPTYARYSYEQIAGTLCSRSSDEEEEEE